MAIRVGDDLSDEHRILDLLLISNYARTISRKRLRDIIPNMGTGSPSMDSVNWNFVRGYLFIMHPCNLEMIEMRKIKLRKVTNSAIMNIESRPPTILINEFTIIINFIRILY